MINDTPSEILNDEEELQRYSKAGSIRYKSLILSEQFLFSIQFQFETLPEDVDK